MTVICFLAFLFLVLCVLLRQGNNCPAGTISMNYKKPGPFNLLLLLSLGVLLLWLLT